MSLDDILKRRALRLKAELSESDRPKPSFLSTIYPAMDHGENMPHVVKTPSSVPSSNDAEAVEADGEEIEKSPPQNEEPGPSKSPSFSQPAVPGQSAMVPDAHKKAAFELGYFGENRSDRFIKRCVELITGVKKMESEDPTEGEDVDISGANGHGHEKGHDHGPGTAPKGGCACGNDPCTCPEDCKCGGTCDKCKAKGNANGDSNGAANGSSGGHDHSKLSDIAKKFNKPKSSYG